tara:strand:- start:78 stop:587 length:510 start_codon:yes stop_codon:yes gene_type:complete
MSIDVIRYKTFSNVIDTLKCVGEQHNQIETITTGDLFEIDLEKNTLYPLFHINPVNVVASSNQLTFNFQLFIMDLVEPDESNEQYVMSDTLQIMTDIVTIFKNGEILHFYDASNTESRRYFTNEDFTIEPFTERFDNSVTGWVTDLPIVVEHEYNSCNIPIDNSTICVK